jgi:hypothetical protein
MRENKYYFKEATLYRLPLRPVIFIVEKQTAAPARHYYSRAEALKQSSSNFGTVNSNLVL